MYYPETLSQYYRLRTSTKTLRAVDCFSANSYLQSTSTTRGKRTLLLYTNNGLMTDCQCPDLGASHERERESNDSSYHCLSSCEKHSDFDILYCSSSSSALYDLLWAFFPKLPLPSLLKLANDVNCRKPRNGTEWVITADN